MKEFTAWAIDTRSNEGHGLLGRYFFTHNIPPSSEGCVAALFKTLDNLLADFGTMPVLHQRLAELAALDNHALVVEAPYADFLNPKKVHHYTPSFCAKAVAELYTLHPQLRIVFCANRKIANEWTRHFFVAVWGLNQVND